MTYSVVFTSKALKELLKIGEPNYSKIRMAIMALVTNPRPVGYKKLSGRDGYRIRQGGYRIIYLIEDNILTVTIVKIAHRKDAYKKK